VIKECAARESTWINRPIIRVYGELHKLGFAHSVEAWFEGKLAGGLYGVALRGAFFGESMFYKVSNASKVCVVKLYEILKQNEYLLFDIQMMTPHFNQLGAIDISKRAYQEILERAMEAERKFKY
jgi:leucyl/phenylalanyl-tRNA--protein transferase